MKKRLLALSLGLALSSISGAFAAIPQHLRIGTDPTYAPFESKNARVNWSVSTSILPKSCANAFRRNVRSLNSRWMR